MRSYLAAALAAGLLVHSTIANAATFPFDVPRQDLALALNQIAQQSHIEIAYSAELTRGKISPALKGTYTPERALETLLKNSGLRVRRIVGGGLVIEKAGAGASASQMPTLNGDATAQFGEIIVTAAKRAQNQREVADSVTAFSGDELSRRGAQSFEDYIGCAPGVIFEQAIPDFSNVTIRGVGTTTSSPDQGQGTTGIYLNDIPLTDPSYAVSILDIDTFDLQRVEVLRGPQGTMFGTATLGGAVNYIINPVDLDTLDARLESSVSGTQHSSNVGYTVKEALNLPIVTNVLGVRITAIKRFDPGYLDNIGTGQNDSNRNDDEEFRINTLWQVNQKVSVSFFSFYDSEDSPDQSYALPALGVLKRDTTIPEYWDFVTRINSLKLNADLDLATLTLAVASTKKAQSSREDFTTYFGPNSFAVQYPTTHMTSLEARLTSPNGGTFEWLVGVYHGALHENYPAPVIKNGQVVFPITLDYLSDETSEFGEATYRFSDQWRATLGGRYYDISLQTEQMGIPGAPQISAGRDVGRGFSPKGSITYEPSSDLLAYALVSKGYRSGGVNLILPPLAGFSTPATYGPDTLVNYEVGVRPTWFDHQLTLDSTLFFIDWTDIQLRLARPDGDSYAANAGGAHNFGVENTLNWMATPNLQFQLSATYLQAQISKTTELGNGIVLPKGTPIPGAPHWSAWGLATYRWNVDYQPYVTVSARFISGAQSAFVDGGAPRSLPIMDYAVFDLRAGFKVKQYDFSLYANNVADRRGVTAAYDGGDGPDPNAERVFYTRPRTVGLRFDWHL
jgi:iron complex outermembrane receptor protein